MNTINTQISDSVSESTTYVMGNAPAESFALLDTVMAETLGMLMHNAVSAQTNAQMIGNAAVTATCARMLSVPMPEPKKPVVPPGSIPPSTPPSPSSSPSPSPSSPSTSSDLARQHSNLDEANHDGSPG